MHIIIGYTHLHAIGRMHAIIEIKIKCMLLLEKHFIMLLEQLICALYRKSTLSALYRENVRYYQKKIQCMLLLGEARTLRPR